MMNEQLYINNVLVDLPGPARIAVTYQANNIGEIQGRQNDFSNVFQLPKTSTNRSVFQNAEILNSATLIPYRQLTARYVVDGVERVQDGVARLVRTTSEAYHVQVISGNASFFGKFPDMTVAELIGDTMDHLNTFTNIVGSRSATTGYIYPLINWMQEGIDTQFNTGSVDAKSLLPCIFIKDIFSLVDQYTGYDSYGSFLDLPDFDNLLLTPNSLARGQNAQDQYNASAKVTTAQTVVLGTNNSAPTFVNYTPSMPDFDGNFTDNLFTADAGLFGYFVFRGEVELQYKRFEFTSRTVKVIARIIRVSDGATIEEQELYNQLTILDPAETIVTVPLPFSVITNNITFNAGDQYQARFYFEDPTQGQVTVKDSVEFSFSLESAIPYGGFVPLGELYEGITVKQVYQDVMNMYCVTPTTNSFQRRVRFALFNELETNKPNAKNWSAKLDGAAYELEYVFGKYAKSNALRYKEHESVTKYYGDSAFSIDDENLPDSATAVQLSVSATEDEIKYQGQLYPRIKSLDSARQFTPTNYRILLLDRKDTTYSHTYTDGTDNLTTAEDIPYCTFRPLMFEQIQANYYGVLTSMLWKTKAPVYRFKLTQVDVQELDYLTPIYLDVHRDDLDVTGYFYISQVSNYVDGFATVSLVRL